MQSYAFTPIFASFWYKKFPNQSEFMNIELTRTLPDDALSAFRVKDMRPDESIIISCDTVAEFNKSRQTAKVVKSQFERPDGYQYKIQSNSSENTIKVSLYKEEESEVSA